MVSSLRTVPFSRSCLFTSSYTSVKRQWRTQWLLVGLPTVVRRHQSILPGHPHIYIFPASEPNTYILTFLSTQPPTAALSLGTTTAIPPTTQSFTSNPYFLPILHSVLSKYAHLDRDVQNQAMTLSSSVGSSLLTSSRCSSSKSKPYAYSPTKSGGSGAGGANLQGGVGSGGASGGWIHVSDLRNPPDWGRINDVEDIFGSVEVEIFDNGDVKVREGSYQSCLGYRIVTRNGIMQLSPFLREKLVEKLREEEKKAQLVVGS